jgi:Bacteriocin-protection, YdeI or OmpD-Associated/Domain of unknown function (DUF1905)
MCLFRTTLIGSGSSAGIDIPPEVIDELGAGKRPPVKVTLAGYTFPSTVAVMGGRFLIAVNAGTRKRTGLQAGDRTEVTVVLDTAPRTPTVPEDLAAAFAAAPGTSEAFARLSAGKQRRLIEHVHQAKAADTRARRIERAVADLSPSPAA